MRLEDHHRLPGECVRSERIAFLEEPLTCTPCHQDFSNVPRICGLGNSCALALLLQVVASMGPPGGGRNPVTPRLLRHFSTVSFAELTDKSICRIFETIISAFATKYLQPDAAATASEIVGATTTVYNSIRVHLLPTPSKSHYTFNLRDIAKVIQVSIQTYLDGGHATAVATPAPTLCQ